MTHDTSGKATREKSTCTLSRASHNRDFARNEITVRKKNVVL